MHKNTTLREAFKDYLDDPRLIQGHTALAEDAPKDWSFTDNGVTHQGKTGLFWLLDQFKDSTDVLPARYCDDLGLQHGATYAHAAAAIRLDFVPDGTNFNLVGNEQAAADMDLVEEVRK
jgi:hypothetical protein